MRTPEEWDAFYRTPNPWGSSGGPEDLVRSESLLTRLRDAHFESAIDFGSGEGRLTNELSQLASQVVGYDISATAVARARKRYPHIEFQQGDLLDVLQQPAITSEPFDFVCVAEMLYYLQTDDERHAAVAGLAKIGRPNCLFFFSVIVTGSSKHRRYFVHEEFVKLLSEHFNVIASFPCLARETWAYRALRQLSFTPALQRRFIRVWTAMHRPEQAKHAGYFALKAGGRQHS